jgi:hypothetical protein
MYEYVTVPISYTLFEGEGNIPNHKNVLNIGEINYP